MTRIYRKPSESIGEVFGRLTVLGIAGRDKAGFAIADCVCKCGKRHETRLNSLRTRKAFSCGCFGRERASEANKTHGFSGKEHDSLEYLTYRSWEALKHRCSKIGHSNQKDHGSRGIEVCPQWYDFAQFLSDMGLRPSKKHSIERRNVNGNYEPNNCYWATAVEQGRNKRNTRWITFDGKTLCLSAWAEELGFQRGVIKDRLGRLGWSIEKALTTPTMNRGKKRFSTPLLSAEPCPETLPR